MVAPSQNAWNSYRRLLSTCPQLGQSVKAQLSRHHFSVLFLLRQFLFSMAGVPAKSTLCFHDSGSYSHTFAE